MDFIQELLDWYKGHGRELPWRNATSPYAVWISEIMLQQTQVGRVCNYYTRWMERFPDVYTLSGADEDEVIRYWEGLGYYARVRNIHKSAQMLVSLHGGKIPDTKEELLALPGIGEYTAGAILSIGFKKAVPAVDANVVRVFSRYFDIDGPVRSTKTQQAIYSKAQDLIPVDKAGECNQALMDFGSLICKKRPLCESCPVESGCESFRLNIVEHRPVPGKPKELIPIRPVAQLIIIFIAFCFRLEYV